MRVRISGLRGCGGRVLLAAFVALASLRGHAADAEAPAHEGVFASQWHGFERAWHEGTPDFYLTGWTYHNRATYSPEQIASYNENAWGAGLGISTREEDGDGFGWYALAFRDSHDDLTKMGGVWYMHYWPGAAWYGAGIGYTLFLGSRPDIYNGAPFPGVLPLAGLKAGHFELLGTYVPKVSRNSTGNGNVGFVFMRIHF